MNTGEPQVLVVDTWPPAPDRDAASLQVVRLVELLTRIGARVTFGSGEPREFQRDYSFELPGPGEQLVGHDAVRDHLASHGDRYDIVWLIREETAEVHLESVRHHAPGAKIVFDTLDLPYLRSYRGAKVTGQAWMLRDALRDKKLVIELVAAADCTTVVSDSERRALLTECPAAFVEVVPLITDPSPAAVPHEQRRGMAFIGNFSHAPNGDAMTWAFEKVMPLVRARRPDLAVDIIGSHIPDWLATSADPLTRALGHVPDLGAALAGYRMTLAPMRYGAGVNGKVLASVAAGVPAVVSPIAAEGIADDGEGILVAESPEDFATAIERLDTDPELWRRVREAGIDRLRTRFSASRVEEVVRGILDRLASPAALNP